MRGTSGARIYRVHDHVRKVGGPGEVGQRVRTQGQWLLTHRGPSLPRVTRVGETAYDMESLFAAPARYLNHDQVLAGMLTGLRDDVWSHEPIVPPDPDELRAKVVGILRAQLRGGEYLTDENPLLGKEVGRLDTLLHGVDWSRLTACLTHGDPTFDNVMFRPDTGDLVLVDPLPTLITGPAVPDLRCVDYGKILQSCLGWEGVRYENVRELFRVSPHVLHGIVGNANEWRATVLFAVVHLVRTLPYVRGGAARLRVWRLIDAAYDLV